MPNQRLRDRIEASIDRDERFGCHLWRRLDPRDGYGVLWTAEGPRQAHRAAYVELVGDVPEGLVLDHLCRRRNCVRVAHLEPITNAENQLRASWGYRCRRLTCPLGHSMSTAMVTPEFGRLCRRCMGPERGLVIADDVADDVAEAELVSADAPDDPELAAIARIYDDPAGPGRRRPR